MSEDWSLLDGAPEGQDDAPARRARRTPRRRRRWPWVLGGSVVALIAVVAITGAVLVNGLNANIERFGDPFADLPTRPPLPTADPAEAGEPEERAPVNVLVLGSDSRISAGDPEHWEAGAQRTDTIMLAHLPADRESAQVMSIPRDSWVEIPGRGEAKINAAFSYGGPALLVQTIEQLTGVRIDHVVVTDFESFQVITDTIGGVDLNLAEDVYDRHGDLIARAGEQTLSGEQALAYVRERYTLRRGDFDRVQRQQAWMRAIVAKVRNDGILRNPPRTYSLLDAISEAVAVDDSLTRNRMQELLWQVRDLGSADLDFFTVPIQGTGTSADGQSIVVLDRPAFDELMEAVREDEVREYLEQNGDAVDRLPSVVP